MIWWGSRAALPLRQAPPSHAPPCTQPRSCSPACGRGEVAELLASSSTSSCGLHLTGTLSSSFCSTPVSTLRPQNPPRLLPVRAPEAPLELLHEPSYPLDPSSYALAPCSSNPSRSPPTTAETTTMSTSPWLDLPRAPLPPLSTSLKSWWASDACTPFGLRSTRL